jgi:zinc protease
MLTPLLALAAAASCAGVLDYPITQKTLPNGLDVVVIETPEFKDVLSFNTLVLAGSGQEQEKGKTGLAHLFEHILFRHRLGGKDGGYDEAINKMGADNNAWTWFDVTYYHPLTFTSNLAKLLEAEAARFSKLDITEKMFKTEAGAVLGEYRRNASRPSERLDERASALMFPGDPYGHTTIGFLADVEDMPNHYEAAKRFYDTYYRPNNCVIVAAGAVKAKDILPKIEAAYKDWKRQDVPPVARETKLPPPDQREDVPWDADVAPLVWLNYRMPAFKPSTKEGAVAQLLAELLVAPAAPLYKKLRYEKQTVSALGFEEGTQGFESSAARRLTVSAQLYKEKTKSKADFDAVIKDLVDGLDALKDFSKQEGAAALLETVKSKYRYDFLGQLTSPKKIASTYAWYYRFERDSKALETLLASVKAVQPADVDAFARRWFVPENRAVLTLKGK